MKVSEAIAFLAKLPDKDLELLIDCPNCGQGNQLAHIFEAVVLSSIPKPKGKAK